MVILREYDLHLTAAGEKNLKDLFKNFSLMAHQLPGVSIGPFSLGFANFYKIESNRSRTDPN